jgi:hybrid cluster-associated redox disulfide protein
MNGAGPQSITASTTIDEVVTRHPATAQVFIRRRVHCVGCEIDRFHTVADVCHIYGQPLESFLHELRQFVSESRQPVSAGASQPQQR